MGMKKATNNHPRAAPGDLLSGTTTNIAIRMIHSTVT
jgi:hypothetical protein